MSSGGGGSKSTTVQKADPWTGQQPYLQGLYQTAANLPQRQYYPGQTVVPFSDMTTNAMTALYNRGLYGSPYTQQAGQAFGSLGAQAGMLSQGVAGTPGWNELWSRANTPAAQGTIGALQATPAAFPELSQLAGGNQFANQFRADVMPQIQAMGSMPLGGQEAIGALGQFTNQGVLGDTSGRWRDISADITGQVTEQMAKAGRLGSGAYAGNLGEQLGRAANVYESDLQNRLLQQRALQQQAAQAQGGLSQQQFGQEMARRQAMGGMFGDIGQMGLQGAGLRANILQGINQTDIARQQAAGGLQLAQQGQQMGGLQNLMAQDLARRQAAMSGFGTMGELGPRLGAMDYTDIQAMLQAGAMPEQLAQKYIQDATSRWDFAQNEPYQRLQAMNQIIQGGYPGGTTSTTGPNPNQQNPIAGALGGASLGGGLATAMGLGGPWGWGLAGIGALAGLF